jgi:hypothetical protein
LDRNSRVGVFEETPVEGEDSKLCTGNSYGIREATEPDQEIGSFESFVFGEVRGAIFEWLAESKAYSNYISLAIVLDWHNGGCILTD